MRHGQFGFNVHGVCLTPIRIVIHAKAGSTKYGEVANVSVAQSPCGAWSFATSSNSDYAVPAFQTDPTKPWCFKTEYDAIWAGLQQLEKKLLQDMHWVEQMEVARRRRMSDEDEEDNAEERNYISGRLQRIKKLLNATREKMDYYNPQQLLLF